MKVRKLLLVENQVWQYNFIRQLLASQYDVYPLINDDNAPSADDYNAFTDHVRVWVNEMYDRIYRDRAFSWLVEHCIQKQGIDIIIMDHKIGGANHCLSGISLARAINKWLVENQNAPLPIIFLSKTEHNEKSRIAEYEAYNKEYPNASTWVHKGYFGYEIMNDNEYFKKFLFPTIEAHLNDSEQTAFFKVLTEIITLDSSLPEHKKIQLQLKKLEEQKYADIPPKVKQHIKEVSTTIEKHKRLDAINISLL